MWSELRHHLTMGATCLHCQDGFVRQVVALCPPPVGSLHVRARVHEGTVHVKEQSPRAENACLGLLGFVIHRELIQDSLTLPSMKKVHVNGRNTEILVTVAERTLTIPDSAMACTSTLP